MIDPQLLTKENGFEDGVVVEIVWLNETDPEFLVWDEIEKRNVCDDDLLPELLSIRPLTGPMSLWNHAPEWAKACSIEADCVNWVANPVFEMTGFEGWSMRPFWATRSKE